MGTYLEIIIMIIFGVRVIIKTCYHGYHPTQDNINLVSGGSGSYQSLAANDQVLNPNGAC